jgi:hypothetical protein
MSRSEILEAAQKIREASEQILTAEQTQLLEQADLISRERKATGITGIVDGFLDALRGERQAAEAQLQRARDREAAIEKLLADSVEAEGEVQRAKATVTKIEKLAASAQAQAQECELAKVWESRRWAMNEPNFFAHVQQCAVEVSTRRELVAGFAYYVTAAQAALVAARERLAGVEKTLAKARK